jgi:AcrR family transcriptional regulator
MARTRSAAAHKKVLDAALELVAEQGIEATSMDAIARKSGVSKATIYKHWADKDALLLEMMASANGLNTRPVFDTGNTRADIIAVLSYRPPTDSGMREKLMPHFVAYSVRRPEFGSAWRTMVMEPPRRELRHLLKQGIDHGELSPAADLELSLAMLLGPLLYWHIFLKSSAPEPAGLAKGIVDAYWKAYGLVRKPARTRPG